MTRRCALLLLGDEARSAGAAPPGIDPRAYSEAMVEDVAEMLHGLSGVDSMVLCPASRAGEVRALVWSDVPVLERAEVGLRSALRAAVERGYDQAVAVAADAPDLPQMIVAKVFQALGRVPVAVAPAEGGGAVALGVRLPAPHWLPATDLDAGSLVRDLKAAAEPRRLVVTPGWHRLRAPGDLRRLDPGLEGWECTRALLSGSGVSSSRGA